MYRTSNKRSQFADLAHPHKLSLATIPTPVAKLDSLHRECPVKISVKREDLTGSTLSGNKVRRLEYVLYEAKYKHATSIITCGNPHSAHIHTTCIAARAQGLDVHFFLEQDSSGKDNTTNELFLASLVGAKINYLSHKQYLQRDVIMTGFANQLKKKGEVPFIMAADNHPSGLWGYVDMFREMLDQRGEVPYTHIVLPVGSGYSLAGLLIAKNMFQKDKVTIIGISTHEKEHVLTVKINDLIQEFNKHYGTNYSPSGYSILADYIGNDGAGGPYPEELYWIQRIAKLEGILLDPVYTGKAFYGLMDQIQKKKITASHNVLFIHTGGTFSLLQNQHLFSFPVNNSNFDIDILLSTGGGDENIKKIEKVKEDEQDEDDDSGIALSADFHV